MVAMELSTPWRPSAVFGLIIPSIIKLGRPCALVIGHLLCMLKQATILQIDRDAGRSERVAPELGLDISGTSAAPSSQCHRVPWGPVWFSIPSLQEAVTLY